MELPEVTRFLIIMDTRNRIKLKKMSRNVAPHVSPVETTTKISINATPEINTYTPEPEQSPGLFEEMPRQWVDDPVDATSLNPFEQNRTFDGYDSSTNNNSLNLFATMPSKSEQVSSPSAQASKLKPFSSMSVSGGDIFKNQHQARQQGVFDSVEAIEPIPQQYSSSFTGIFASTSQSGSFADGPTWLTSSSVPPSGSGAIPRTKPAQQQQLQTIDMHSLFKKAPSSKSTLKTHSVFNKPTARSSSELAETYATRDLQVVGLFPDPQLCDIANRCLEIWLAKMKKLNVFSSNKAELIKLLSAGLSNAKSFSDFSDMYHNVIKVVLDEIDTQSAAKAETLDRMFRTNITSISNPAMIEKLERGLHSYLNSKFIQNQPPETAFRELICSFYGSNGPPNVLDTATTSLVIEGLLLLMQGYEDTVIKNTCVRQRHLFLTNVLDSLKNMSFKHPKKKQTQVITGPVPKPSGYVPRFDGRLNEILLAADKLTSETSMRSLSSNQAIDLKKLIKYALDCIQAHAPPDADLAALGRTGTQTTDERLNKVADIILGRFSHASK